MKLQELSTYRKKLSSTDFIYRADLFSKAIWGDMGEDCASIHVSAQDDHWHLHFIRTQSGEPYPLADTVCNVIDEYEKDLDDEALFDLLSMHQLIQDFQTSITMCQIKK